MAIKPGDLFLFFKRSTIKVKDDDELKSPTWRMKEIPGTKNPGDKKPLDVILLGKNNKEDSSEVKPVGKVPSKWDPKILAVKPGTSKDKANKMVDSFDYVRKALMTDKKTLRKEAGPIWNFTKNVGRGAFNTLTYPLNKATEVAEWATRPSRANIAGPMLNPSNPDAIAKSPVLQTIQGNKNLREGFAPQDLANIKNPKPYEQTGIKTPGDLTSFMGDLRTKRLSLGKPEGIQ